MGRKFKSFNTFSQSDSNTICDITGFKVKRSQVLKRWDGFYVIADAYHPRHPQDYPVVPVPQYTFDDIRTEDLTTTPAEPWEPI